jgi:SanA protein
MVIPNVTVKMSPRWSRRLLWALIAVPGLVAVVNLVVMALGAHYASGSPSSGYQACILMGTDPIGRDGRTNEHFHRRVSTAVEAVRNHSINTLIVTGHTNNRGYNEVLGMKDELMARGLASDRIQLDFGGFRTFESARRARDVFEVTNALVVTDPFHGYRTALLFRYFGVTARIEPTTGSDVGWIWWRHQLREVLARCRAVLDITGDFVVRRFSS